MSSNLVLKSNDHLQVRAGAQDSGILHGMSSSGGMANSCVLGITFLSSALYV